MTITTEEAERLATEYGGFWGLTDVAAALRSLAAERDALQARVAELDGALRDLMLPQTPASFAGSMRVARAALTGGKDE